MQKRVGEKRAGKTRENEHSNADVDASTQFCMLVKSQLSLTETDQTIEVRVGGKRKGKREGEREEDRERETGKCKASELQHFS